MTPDDPGGAARAPRNVGLCADCQRARRVTSSKGSAFYMCTYSEVDPAYPKYPQLPVVQCAAYMRET